MKIRFSITSDLARRAGVCGVALLLALPVGGCFSERSFPAVSERLIHLDLRAPDAATRPAAADWASRAHAQMRALLPENSRAAVTSADLLAHGQPVDLYRRMNINPEHVDSLLFNLDAIEQTAQVSSPPADKERPEHWDGWQTVEIPMADGATLCARLAPPTGHDLGGSYVVMTHGLFGRMDGLDVRNHLAALRQAGHHVLAVEMRGHGSTAEKYPRQGMTFGACETTDLLAVARWLKVERHARRVGLLSFSITGYQSLLTAWLDGGGLDEMGKSPMFARVPPVDPLESAYNGGIFIVSPPVNMMKTGAIFNQPYTLLSGAVKSSFQERCRQRMIERGAKPSYRMWDLIDAEYRLSTLYGQFPDVPSFQHDLRQLIDLERDNWAPGHRRLEMIRTPVLILAAGNDPLGTAQAVVDLAAGVKNPNLGVIILPQGGHMGFPAVSADYYYSLLLNFFDPATAPAPAAQKVAGRSEDRPAS